MNCLNCQKTLVAKYTKKFCCMSCSATFNNKNRRHKDETKLKISNSAKKNPKGFTSPDYVRSPLSGKQKDPLTRHIIMCKTCNNPFEKYKKERRVFCSPTCVQTGGYRKGSGRAKTGYYKSYYCGSTYELAYLIYHLDHNIKIKKCDKVFNYYDSLKHRVRKYYPDFIVDDTIIEIKGYKTQEVIDKSLSMPSNYKILFKEDLKEIFDYIESKYSIKISNLHTLYE